LVPSGDEANGEAKYNTRVSPDRDALAAADLLLLFAAALAVRWRLIFAYPAVYGGDAVARLAHSDTLVLAYQLPLPQLLVFLARAADPDPTWTRLVFAAVGALVPVALAFALAPLAGGVGARAAAVLAALHPLLVYYSLVPYQESAMLALLLAAGAALHRGRERTAGFLVGLACLCRYEAWIAAAVAATAAVRRRPPGRELVRRLVLFGWAPLGWMLFWRGLSPGGTYVLDVDAAPAPLARLAFVWGKLYEYSGGMLLLLAAVGTAIVAVRRVRTAAWAAAYLALAAGAVALAGHEFPVGSGRVSERLAHLPATAACALAGWAMGALWTAARGRARPAAAAVIALVLASTSVAWQRRSEMLVAEANRDPSTALAVQVARFAHERLPPGGRLAVAAPSVPESEIEGYLERIERSGGDVGRARDLAAALLARTVEGNRIAAHLPRNPDAVVAAGSPADLVVVYDDALRPDGWRTGRVLARFTSGARSATVYAVPPGSFRRPSREAE
jgi:hypothetical protein